MTLDEARKEMSECAHDVEILRPFAQTAVGSTGDDNERVAHAWDLARSRFQVALQGYIDVLEGG